MKKLFSLVFIIIFILVLTGCGTSTITCELGKTEKLMVSLKSNKVDSIKVEIEFGSEKAASEYCEVDKEAKCDGTKATTKLPEFKLNKFKGLSEKEFLKEAKKEGATCK